MLAHVFILLKSWGISQISKEKVVAYIWNRHYGKSDVMVLTVIAGVALYIYCRRKAKYFEKSGIKSLPTFPIVGNMLKVVLQQESFLGVLDRTYKAFPDQKYIGHMQINYPLIMIKDLEVLRQVGIKNFDHFVNHHFTISVESDSLFGNHLFALKGDKWHDMRATLSPAFTSSKMKDMFEFIDEIGNQMVEFYTKKMEEDECKERGLVEVELKDAFTRYTNDVIATSAFGLKVNSLDEPDNTFYEMGKKSTNFGGLRTIKFFLFSSFPRLMKLTNLNIFDETVKQFFRNLVLGTMKNREEQGILRNDMINLLMEAKKCSLLHEDDQERHDDAGFATVQESEVGKKKVKRNWSDDDIVAQAFLFFLAGFETSATLLCFMAHELTVNPNVQKKLQEEIDEVLAESGDNLDYNVLMKMKYMDMVVSETLRMWPPLAGSDRECLKPFKLPPPDDLSEGYTIQPGEGIWIPISGIHHDPAYYPDPETFDPERFSDDNKHKIAPMTFLPFGIGPRNCIGSRFAMMEAKSVIFHLLAKFDFVETAKTSRKLTLPPTGFNLIPKGGFWVGLKPRNL